MRYYGRCGFYPCGVCLDCRLHHRTFASVLPDQPAERLDLSSRQVQASLLEHLATPKEPANVVKVYDVPVIPSYQIGKDAIWIVGWDKPRGATE